MSCIKTEGFQVALMDSLYFDDKAHWSVASDSLRRLGGKTGVEAIEPPQ